MIRVIVDWGVYYEAKGGGYRCFREIIPRISKTPGFEIVLYSDIADKVEAPLNTPVVHTRITPSATWFPNGKLKNSLKALAKKIDSTYWKFRLRNKLSGALFHSPYYTLSPVPDIPEVPTIHDLITEKFKHQTNSQAFDYIRRQKEVCIRKATRLIAVSQKTKDDLVEFFGIDPNKVDVVYHGVNTDFFKAPSKAEKTTFLEKHDIKNPFIFHVGGRLNHKNFRSLLEAFGTSFLKKDLLLVSAGAESWNEEEKKLIAQLGISDMIRFVKNPSDESLKLLYHSANLFVFPSFYEGFGIPLLEAMAAGTPVACSSGGSLPEVLGNAGLLFDPFNPQDIASKLEQLLDPKLSSQFSELGKKRAAQFTWDNTASETMETYRKTLRDWQTRK